MKNWIEKIDFHEVRYLAASVKSDQLLNQCVTEAMIFDVQPFLGSPLFLELASQFDAKTLTGLNAKLLDGGTYAYYDKTYLFQGLKKCLMYYAFARYTKRDGVKYTASGPVIKDDDLSEPIPDKTRVRVANEDYELAGALRAEVIQYLNCLQDSYPLWCMKPAKSNARFHLIGD